MVATIITENKSAYLCAAQHSILLLAISALFTADEQYAVLHIRVYRSVYDTLSFGEFKFSQRGPTNLGQR